MRVKIPVGNSDFKDIIENKYYYVDKTGFVKDLLEPDLAKVTLITRPRRFGKTLGMSMLANFFDIKKDSKALFNGLEITKHTKLCSQWMNQYPTIFVSFKDVNGLTFSSVYEMLVFTIMNLYKKHLYLLDSNKINSYNKATIEKIITGNASVTEIKTSLLLLIEAMKTYYNKQVIVLIDEYDVPIAKASANGYYEEMMEVIRALMSTALKDNNFLKFAVLTGCLRVTKESIFTGTNNLVVNTINSSSLNEYFGFTQKDVDKLLEDAKMTNHAKDIKDWYDGYHFKEDFYHAFLAGIFTGAGYMVESNHEHGEGRSDVVVIDSYGGKVAIFEAKYSQSIENLETDCNKALNQINKKMYAKDFEDSYDEVLCFGISFYKKRCLVKYATS